MSWGSKKEEGRSRRSWAVEVGEQEEALVSFVLEEQLSSYIDNVRYSQDILLLNPAHSTACGGTAQICCILDSSGGVLRFSVDQQAFPEVVSGALTA